MSTPVVYGKGGLPVEARLERLEQNLRQLRRDLDTAQTVLGEDSPLVSLLRGYSPLLPPPIPGRREQQLRHLFD